MSVAWNLRLPYLYSSAAPGREWQDYLISPLLERERLVARSGKKRLVCIPTLPRYLLKEPPRGQPSPVIRPKQHGKIAASTSTSKKYRYLYLSGPITTTKKVPPQPQPKTSFCPTNLPRDTSFSNVYLIFDMYYAYYKVNTHTHTSNLPFELYSDSTCSTSGLSQAPLANLFSRSSTSYLVWDVMSQQQQQLFSTLKKKKAARQPRRQTRRGISQSKEEEQQQQQQPISSHDPRYCLQFSSESPKLKPIEASSACNALRMKI